ncbi:thiazole biosynthesis ThiG family protein [Lysobacter capsici]|uniref:N-acetylmannosamine-6-phosphate 2-epimerase n=1 Tax=Lysobacter capsici TaxID=435897 RepID=UPI0007167309|nr:N-acetylmannosamine-6-phosphate 2-epimerase [Lysobacter capsici]ALN88209.1 thiazole biosynthesis ThiG family protein [Lysobacter capsici]
MSRLFERLRGGLAVSCQALPGEPMHGCMPAMARAAIEGGACGVLANGANDIARIRAAVDAPLIGVLTQVYPDCEIALTPTLVEVDQVAQAGADMAGLDASERRRPGGQRLADFYAAIRKRHPGLRLMAEVATTVEALRAQALGFDCVSSAALGHTQATRGQRLPDDDFAAFRRMRRAVDGCLLVAEGGIDTPQQAARALQLGADFVVVGSAITRPQNITARFVGEMKAIER